MLRKFILMIFSLVFTSCVTKKLDHTEFSLPDDVKPGFSSPQKLISQELEYDKAQLIQILNRGYAGRFVVSPKILKAAKQNIKKIKGPISTKEFCEKVGYEFDKIPDYHLHIRGFGKKCSKIKQNVATVGMSFAEKRKKLWVVEKNFNKGKSILYISITKFPAHLSSEWRGFLEKVQRLHWESDIVVLDLRGNTGGDDTTGYKLSAYFHKADFDKEAGFDFPTPYAMQITSQTPETLVLKINGAKFSKRFGYGVPEVLEKWQKESEASLTKVLKGELKEVKYEDSGRVVEDWKFSGFKNPLYILIDERCFSSCESTVDSFEYNPNVKKVGRNTAGMLHFGNVVPLILKNSKLYVQTPTHANIYRDKRFIEKTGIAPDVKVPSGEDAYQYLLEKVL